MSGNVKLPTIFPSGLHVHRSLVYRRYNYNFSMAVHTKLVIFIGELRSSIRNLALALGLCTLGVFFLSPHLLQFVQQHLADQLYFFSVSGPFLAHVKLALFGAFYILMPWFMTSLWKAMGKPFGVVGEANATRAGSPSSVGFSALFSPPRCVNVSPRLSTG